MNERDRKRGWGVQAAPSSLPLPRYTEQAVLHDPLERLIATMQAKEAEAVAAVNAGRCLDANPQDLRGIPVIGRGVGGTSPGSDPFMAVQWWPER